MVHFGLWAEEGAALFGQHDAWAIVGDAVKRTSYENVRSDKLEDALGYLARFAVRKRPFEDFRAALDIQSPLHRYTTMREAAERIRKAISP